MSDLQIGDVQVTSPSPCSMTLTKDFASLPCKFHPTWRKLLCPLNPLGVVAITYIKVITIGNYDYFCSNSGLFLKC